MKSATKINLLPYVLLAFSILSFSAFTGYFWLRWQELEAVSNTDLSQEYNRQTFSDKDIGVYLRARLLEYLEWGQDSARLNLEAQRLASDSVYADYSVFVDNGKDTTIVVQKDKSLVGQSNATVKNGEFSEAFNKIHSILYSRIGADSIYSDSYELPGEPGNRRYGIFYLDSSSEWIYGLVVKRPYFERKTKELFSEMAFVSKFVPFLLFIPFSIFFFGYYLWKIKPREQRRGEYELALENANVGVAILDRETSTILDINQKFEDLYDRDKYYGNRLLKVSSYPDIKQIWEECVKAGPDETKNHHVSYRNPGQLNGTQREVSKVTLTRYGDRVVMTTTDVTEIVHVYGILGHDLRNQLAASSIGMQNAVNFIGRLQDDEERRLLGQYLNRVQASLVATESYASALEVWAEQESGILLDRKEKVDVGRELLELKKLFAPVFTVHGTNAEFYASGNQEILTSARALRAVLRNLLSNTMAAFLNEKTGQYRERPKSVIVSADGREGWLIITVRDNGPGIPEIVRQRMINKDYSALGLGSRIVDEYVKKMNGTIGVTASSSLTGTTITMKLPQNPPTND